MAHRVKLEMPAREVDIADVRFTVLKDGRTFGHLFVSRGSVVWRRSPKSIKARKMSWSRLDAIMQERGKPVRGT